LFGCSRKAETPNDVCSVGRRTFVVWSEKNREFVRAEKRGKR
jgi:hypothetical protein